MTGKQERGGTDAGKMVTLAYASDPRFMDAERKGFMEKWGKESEVTRVPGSVEAGQLSSHFMSRGIFETVTVLHLWQAEKFGADTVQELLGLLSKPACDVAMLIEYAGDLSERNRKLTKAWREIASLAGAVNCNPPSLRSYIIKRARENGMRIEDEALESLEQWANKDLALLPSALDLLCLAAMETKSITSGDVADLLGAGGSPNIFALQDCFLQKDREGVVSMVKKIEGDEDAFPLAFVSVMARHLDMMMKVHGMMAGGLHPEEIRPEMVEKSVFPWQLEKVKRDAARWSPEETFAALQSLAALDRGLKGDPGEPWATVERHLLLILSGKNGAGRIT